MLRSCFIVISEKIKILSVCTSLIIFSAISYAQVGIGTTTVDRSSILHIDSSNSGVLLPNVSLTNTTTNLGNIPSESLLIYNTSVVNDVKKGFYFWEKNNQWSPFITNLNDLTVTANTPWNILSTNTPSSSYLDNVYTLGTTYVKPDSGLLALGLGRILYTESYAGDLDINTFGHFSNTNTSFNINICHGAGTSYSTVMSIDDNGGHGISGDWDVGSLRFVGTARLSFSIFSYLGRDTYAEIKVKSWGNGNISATRAPAQMWFETCEDGFDDSTRVFRINLHGVVQFNYNRSVANWATSDLATDKIVGIKNDKFIKIDKAALMANRTQNNNAVDLDTFTYNKSELNIGNITENFATVNISGKNKKSPVTLEDCPVFNSNEEALENGLQEGMVYKTTTGNLKIVI
ncbi:hypothetical protein [Flavobacterium sp.]|uniref:hypothetical protein n=1 Tax=Flavobacterium sp. TaxID=239 RepID=UPI003529793D